MIDFTTLCFPVVWSEASKERNYEKSETGKKLLKDKLDNGFKVKYVSTCNYRDVMYAYYYLEKTVKK